jgi:hypothetical protein
MKKLLVRFAGMSSVSFCLALGSIAAHACDGKMRPLHDDAQMVRTIPGKLDGERLSGQPVYDLARLSGSEGSGPDATAQLLLVVETQGGHGNGIEYADGSVPHNDGTTHLDERFRAADKNHDGGLDREEAKQMPMLSQYFDEVDTNKDGKVTRQEYFDAMPLLHGVKKIDTSGKAKQESM